MYGSTIWNMEPSALLHSEKLSHLLSGHLTGVGLYIRRKLIMNKISTGNHQRAAVRENCSGPQEMTCLLFHAPRMGYWPVTRSIRPPIEISGYSTWKVRQQPSSTSRSSMNDPPCSHRTADGSLTCLTSPDQVMYGSSLTLRQVRNGKFLQKVVGNHNGDQRGLNCSFEVLMA